MAVQFRPLLASMDKPCVRGEAYWCVDLAQQNEVLDVHMPSVLHGVYKGNDAVKYSRSFVLCPYRDILCIFRLSIAIGPIALHLILLVVICNKYPSVAGQVSLPADEL